MPIPSSFRAAALLAVALGGCQALGGGGGVMPETEIGPPPSARGTVPGRAIRSAEVDEDGAPLPSTPTRRLDLPKTVRGDTRTAETATRRISREEIEGSGPGARGSSGLAPSLSPSGGVGVGGRF